MIDLSIYNNYCNEVINDDNFFLDDPDIKIVERFGLWGRVEDYQDQLITKQILYHNIVDDVGVISDKEGIEIIWDDNPFNINNDDYYRKIK